MSHQRFPLCALGLAASCLAGTSSFAQDAEGGLRLDFGIEQGFEYGRNIGFAVPAEGSTARSATELSFGLFSSTPLDRLELTASGALIVENTPDTDGTEAEFGRPRLAFSYTREVPDALFGIALSYTEDSVDRLSEDLSDTDSSGTQIDYGMGLRFEVRRTAPASLFFAADYDVTEYDDTVDPDLIDTRTTTAMAGTHLRFSEVLAGSFSLRFTREDEDGSLATDDALTASFDLERDLPNGSATLEFSQVNRESGDDQTTLVIGRTLDFPSGGLSVHLGATRSTSDGADLVGGLAWTHALPDGEVSASLGRSVGYDISADETIITTEMSLGWLRQVSSVSTIGLDLSWSQRDAPSELIEVAEITATYSAALTLDWQLDSGISYRVRNDADGRAESPELFVSLGRVFSVRP
ncbi:MAG TPA: hypothetical protein PKA03_01415 [Tabrizicola sp.]|nr:hypothetical protein [Tabrizicola sp.]